MTNQERFDAAHTLYESLCRLKAKPSVIIFKRYFACTEEEAETLLRYAVSKSVNPRRWSGKNGNAKEAGKMTTEECEMYFCAFRYCLGRRTYVVSDFCEYATKKIAQIQSKWLFLMDKEITDAENADKEEKEIFLHRLGDDCDKVEWLKFREVVRAELRKRNEQTVY